MPKIFVPCQQAMTVSKAKLFGDLKVLHDESNPNKSASRLGLEPDRLFGTFIRPLNTWEPGDMILLDGPLIYNAVATSVLACFTNTMRFMVWNGKHYEAKVAYLASVTPKRTWKRGQHLRRVYAVNNVHNVEPASKFGKIVYVNREPLEDRPPPTNPRYVLDKISAVLKRTHKSDFLMLSGSKLENAISSAILSRMHGSVNYLIFHHGRKIYLPRSVDFSKSRIKKAIRDRLKP